MTYVIGIDDAGRGPVIGPMILNGVLAKEQDIPKIQEMGAKDSKLLAPKKRKEISDNLKQMFSYHAEITSPEEIDSCINLNTLEALKAAIIINVLLKKIEIQEKVKIIIDCPSVNTKAWGKEVTKYILEEFQDKIDLKSEHKADFNYPIVSAASIIAKETREEQVEKIKQEYKIDFGSGYPSDPKTKEFIEKYYDNENLKRIIRHSWETVKKLKQKSNQKKLF
jgi:ribonuclease HII